MARGRRRFGGVASTLPRGNLWGNLGAMAAPKKPRRKPGMQGIHPRWIASKKAWHWVPKLKIAGKTVSGRSYPTQEEAFAAFLRMRERGEVITERGDVTLEQAFAITIERLLANGGSDYTARGYRVKFRKWSEILNPSSSVHDITIDDVEWFKAERRRRHGVSNNTVRDNLVILGTVLQHGGVPDARNPARLARRPKADEPERPFFTMPEVYAISERMRQSEQPSAGEHADLVLFLALTGIRSFEMERLRADDFVIEPDGGVVRVRQRKGKANCVREIVFASRWRDLMERIASRCVTDRLMHPSTLSTTLQRWQKRLAEPRLSGRALRRTFGTDWAEHAPLRTVQTQMGHTNLTTTQRYLGARTEVARDAAERSARRMMGED